MTKKQKPSQSNVPSEPADERRRWTRVQVDLPVTVSLAGGKSEARVRDISRAGVCFFLDRPIPMMTVLELSMKLKLAHGVKHVGGRGAVVRCEKIAKAIDHYEIAVFLHEMSEQDRSVIEEYVALPQKPRVMQSGE